MRGIFIGACTGASLILFMAGALFATIGDESGGAICMVFATVSGLLATIAGFNGYHEHD